MPFHYHFPVDPDCPEAAKLLAAEQEGYDDPMTQYYGASDCIADLYASKKRKLGDAISFDSIEHSEIKVDLMEHPDVPEGSLWVADGSLASEIPNIEVWTKLPTHSRPVLRLTWEEARKLCAALWQVTNIAEFG